jgi:hypothetical protein
MKQVIDALHNAFMNRELDYCFVQCVDAGGFNSMAITNEEAKQISKDYGYELEIVDPNSEFEGKTHDCKFKFRRALV